MDTTTIIPRRDQCCTLSFFSQLIPTLKLLQPIKLLTQLKLSNIKCWTIFLLTIKFFKLLQPNNLFTLIKKATHRMKIICWYYIFPKYKGDDRKLNHFNLLRKMVYCSAQSITLIPFFLILTYSQNQNMACQINITFS